MAQSSAFPAEQYNFDIVRKFMIVAMIYGVIGMTVGVYIASELAWPFLNFDIPALKFRHSRSNFRAFAPRAHQPGYFRFRRQRSVCHVLLYRAAYLPGTAGVPMAG